MTPFLSSALLSPFLLKSQRGISASPRSVLVVNHQTFLINNRPAEMDSGYILASEWQCNPSPWVKCFQRSIFYVTELQCITGFHHPFITLSYFHIGSLVSLSFCLVFLALQEKFINHKKQTPKRLQHPTQTPMRTQKQMLWWGALMTLWWQQGLRMMSAKALPVSEWISTLTDATTTAEVMAWSKKQR